MSIRRFTLGPLTRPFSRPVKARWPPESGRWEPSRGNLLGSLAVAHSASVRPAGRIAVAYMALQEGARLDGQDLMDDVPDHLRRPVEGDGIGANLAGHLAADPRRLRHHVAVHDRAFADGERPALDIAFDDSVHLQVAGTDQVAQDLEVGTDDGGRGAARGWTRDVGAADGADSGRRFGLTASL